MPSFRNWFEARLYPELSRFPDPQRARLILIEYAGLQTLTLRFWLSIAGYVAATTLFVGFARLLTRTYRIAPQRPIALATLFACCLIGPLVASWMTRRRTRRALRQALVAEGIPICVPCGYDLRGLPGPCCPECGEAFDAALLDAVQPPTPTPAGGEATDARHASGHPREDRP